MGRDTDLTGIIREIVQFLERLGEVKLPSILENVRGDLLVRSKDALVACATVTSGPSSSPEPYLSMSPGNGSAARGLLLLAARDALTWKQEDPQEYVGAEEPRAEKTESQQDYYETFQDVHRPVEAAGASPVEQSKRNENVNASLHEIYSSFSAEQTKSKCVKCGPLRKGGKKLFLFEQHRDCWAGLVGSYLLIYGSEKDSRPCMVQPIRGSTARPAPNVIPRDSKKSESTFELLTPGNKTLQFIARSPKDMEQWIAKISRVNSYEQDDDVITHNGKTEDVLAEKNAENVVQENYQDVGPPKNNDTKDESTILRGRRTPVQRDETTKETGSRNGEQTDEDGKSKGKTGKNKDNPPPLPARIPRRLPSLPSEKTVVTVHCDAPEEEEEDDFYHRIDDFKDMARYQNVAKKSKKTEDALESYDDVESVVKELRKEKETGGKDEKRKSIDGNSAEVVEEIYDDVASVLREEKRNDVKEKSAGKGEISEIPSYDDVQKLAATKAGKDQRRKQEKSAEEPAKSPVKKSFLDRVRSGRKQQRESSGKGEKRLKRKTPTPPPATTSVSEESPLYDDVSNLPAANRQEPEVPEETELPEYNCPPPPRPIYVPPVSVAEVEDIYDDIGVARRTITDEIPTTMDVGSTKINCVQMNVIQTNERNLEEIDGEHYQSPKSSMPVGEQVEELYDDIAILADFTARQREMANKKPEVGKSLSSSPEKKPWNRRFGGSRKSKCSELLVDGSMAEVNGQRSSGEIDDLDSHLPEQSHKSVTRKNTFQKLINKMENSLGKASSLSPGKTNSTNDGT